MKTILAKIAYDQVSSRLVFVDLPSGIHDNLGYFYMPPDINTKKEAFMAEEVLDMMEAKGVFAPIEAELSAEKVKLAQTTTAKVQAELRKEKEESSRLRLELSNATEELEVVLRQLREVQAKPTISVVELLDRDLSVDEMVRLKQEGLL